MLLFLVVLFFFLQDAKTDSGTNMGAIDVTIDIANICAVGLSDPGAISVAVSVSNAANICADVLLSPRKV